MSQQTDDFALGTHALLGRAIGEVNGMLRRVDKLERDLVQLQERLDAKPSRAEYLFFVALLVFAAVSVGGLLIAFDGWASGRMAFLKLPL